MRKCDPNYKSLETAFQAGVDCSKWISCWKQLPVAGQSVLFADDEGFIGIGCIVILNYENTTMSKPSFAETIHWYDNTGSHVVNRVLYWQPLPKLP